MLRYLIVVLPVLGACDSPGGGGYVGMPPGTVPDSDGLVAETVAEQSEVSDEVRPIEPDASVALDAVVPDTVPDTFAADTVTPDTVTPDTSPPETVDTSEPDTFAAETVDTTPAETSPSDTTPSEVVADPCPVIPLAPLDSPQPQVFEMQTSGLGSAAVPDVIAFEFYMVDQFGIFDLGSSTNADYATCEQCVRVFQDRDAPVYFQARGRLTLLPLSEPQGQFIAGTISGVDLYEVTIDPSTFHATAVPNGRCLRLQDGTLSMF